VNGRGISDEAARYSARAGEAWREGRRVAAAGLMRLAQEAEVAEAEARGVEPSGAYGDRMAWIRRQSGHCARLEEQTAIRLALAGIHSGDEGLAQLRQWNSEARGRAGLEAAG